MGEIFLAFGFNEKTDPTFFGRGYGRVSSQEGSLEDLFDLAGFLRCL